MRAKQESFTSQCLYYTAHEFTHRFILTHCRGTYRSQDYLRLKNHMH